MQVHPWRKARSLAALLWACLALFSTGAHAQVIISEVMYDPSGPNLGRQWIEVWNEGSATAAISRWAIEAEGKGHPLRLVQGTSTLLSGEHAVIAADPKKFLADWPAFSGTLLRAAISLRGRGDALALKNGTADQDRVSYSSDSGAVGDGRSLNRDSLGGWLALGPTPGATHGPVPIPAPLPIPAKASSTLPQAGQKKAVRAKKPPVPKAPKPKKVPTLTLVASSLQGTDSPRQAEPLSASQVLFLGTGIVAAAAFLIALVLRPGGSRE